MFTVNRASEHQRHISGMQWAYGKLRTEGKTEKKSDWEATNRLQFLGSKIV